MASSSAGSDFASSRNIDEIFIIGQILISGISGYSEVRSNQEPKDNFSGSKLPSSK